MSKIWKQSKETPTFFSAAVFSPATPLENYQPKRQLRLMDKHGWPRSHTVVHLFIEWPILTAYNGDMILLGVFTLSGVTRLTSLETYFIWSAGHGAGANCFIWVSSVHTLTVIHTWSPHTTVNQVWLSQRDSVTYCVTFCVTVGRRRQVPPATEYVTWYYLLANHVSVTCLVPVCDLSLVYIIQIFTLVVGPVIWLDLLLSRTQLARDCWLSSRWYAGWAVWLGRVALNPYTL